MKSSLKNLNLFTLFLWLCCHVPLHSPAQQKKSDPLISITAVSMPVSQVLDKLTRDSGITFSYNPDHIEASRLVSLSMKDVPLTEVLGAILPADRFGFRISGRQVVIFRKPIAAVQSLSQPAITIAPGNRIAGNAEPDTVYITRSDIVRDTITLKDTILKFDTVYLMRTIVRENPITGKDIFSNQTSLPKEQTRELKFEPGVSINWLPANPFFSASGGYDGKLREYREAWTGSLLSGSLGLDLKLSYARFSFATGLSFLSLKGKLDYQYDLSSGGNYRKDTLDIYYTLENTDTTWFYVLDSTYIPVNRETFKYNTPVKHRYIEIPLCFQYNHPAGRNLVYVKAGLIAGIHAGSKGLMILPEEKGVAEMEKTDFRPLVFSWTFGAGIVVPVNGRYSFDGGINYRWHSGSLFSGFPVQVAFRSFGVRAGIVYKF